MEAADTVIIGGKSYKVKNTLRSLFIFEEIANKPFSLERMIDRYLYLYSVLLACNPGCGLQWDEFIGYLDSDPGIVERMGDVIKKAGAIDALINGEGAGADGEKKN